MSQAASKTTSGGTPPPFNPEVIDLTNHPDAPLLRLGGGRLARGVRDAHDRLENAIAGAEAELRRTPAVTDDGRRLRELAL